MPLRATISHRSKNYAGLPLYPHRHDDGMYVASHTRFEADYIRVGTLEQLEALVRAGYSARMPNPDIKQAPSLIVRSSIEITDDGTTPPLIASVLLDATAKIDLDVASSAKRRVEQSLLRALLLGGMATGLCILCGKEFPENLLVAAHLKRRPKCSDSEKHDFCNVAALMCKFGCDDLYEKGYIFIAAGQIHANDRRLQTLL